MSAGDDAEPVPPIHPFLQMFGGGEPPTPEQQLEARRKVTAFAKAAIPSLREMQRLVRDLDTLYADSPVRMDWLAIRNAKIRKRVALTLDALEGIAER